MEALQRQQAARLAQGVGPLAPPRLPLPQPPLLGARTRQAEGASGVVRAEEEEDAEEEEEGEAPLAEQEAAEESHPAARCPNSPSNQPPGLQPHEWTYEEQFKQVGTDTHTPGFTSTTSWFLLQHRFFHSPFSSALQLKGSLLRLWP